MKQQTQSDYSQMLQTRIGLNLFYIINIAFFVKLTINMFSFCKHTQYQLVMYIRDDGIHALLKLQRSWYLLKEQL